MARIIFDANDTLFFREARPMESIGAKPLAGRFPPPARTIVGAVRSVIGELLGADWPKYRRGDASQHLVMDVIGDPRTSDIGKLSLTGPFPVNKGMRLYPAPLSILSKVTDDKIEYTKLRPGDMPVTCDLGSVYLPEMVDVIHGAKPLENSWLNREDFEAVMSGKFPDKPLRGKDLFDSEPRLGIARDYARHSVKEGMLYQTVHARLREHIQIGVDVTGYQPNTSSTLLTRLGGEGRMASAQWSSQDQPHLSITKPQKACGIIFTLLTPARFEDSSWLPPGFDAHIDERGAMVWRGKIAGIKLTILSTILGKSFREGGWDLARHRSRPAESLIPAGSVFFCTTEIPLDKAVTALQQQKIGLDIELGRGEIAAGYWLNEKNL